MRFSWFFFSYTLNTGVNSRSVQRQTCPVRINISTSRRPCPSFLWMLQFYTGSQLCLSWAVCPSFPEITHGIYKVPIISSSCSILPMTKISLNTCTSRWEVEVAIGKGITATILTRQNSKAPCFEFLELRSWKLLAFLQCLKSNAESRSRRAENVKIISLHLSEIPLISAQKPSWALPGFPVDFYDVS